MAPFTFPGIQGELATAYRCDGSEALEAEIRRLIDPAAALRTLHWGRNYLYLARFETADGPVEVVVKQFRAGGARERLRTRLRGGKAARSWRIAHALKAAGVPTPDPVLLVEPTAESIASGGPSFYICRHLSEALEARYLFRAVNAGRLAEEFPGLDFPCFLTALAATLRRLHDAGLWHRDVSGGNILLHDDTVYLLDLNRTRRLGRLTTPQCTRDLSRLALFRPEDQETLLRAYWGDGLTAARRRLYLLYHHAFLAKNRTKQRLRGGTGALRSLFHPRRPHTHIPEAPAAATARDKIVWDHLSDQPHQHAGGVEKLGVRLADARAHVEEAAVIAASLPRIVRRYRALQRELHRHPVTWGGAGVCLRPWTPAPDELLALVAELGCRHLLLRLHPWEGDHGAEEALARELHARGHELTFALPQNRDLVRDPERWRHAIEELAARFTPYGRHFQVGQAINRSKWGVWNLEEYVTLARIATDVLHRYPSVEVLGPSVIDFEYHVTAAVLNLDRPGLAFDAVSSLLYVDRRGAPENTQAGLDTVDKVVLLRALAETARNAAPRAWVTEVNWPLREGPHSPAGRAVSVDEETQADYLVRYYLLALGTGLLERVFWWQLIAQGYGLVDAALRRRPSFRALQTLLRLLPEGSILTVLPAPESAHLYQFQRPDGTTLLAAWSHPGPLRLDLPQLPQAVTDRDGNPRSLPVDPTVDLTPSVTYFTL